jgi:hypothetical protein
MSIGVDQHRVDVHRVAPVSVDVALMSIVVAHRSGIDRRRATPLDRVPRRIVQSRP